MQRWQTEPVTQYLITLESSENKAHPWSVESEKEALRTFSKTYPAIRQHLEAFRERLIDRDDQGRFYWELRSCTYYGEFEKPKIVSTKISIRPTFAFDRDGCYLGNTSYFIPAGAKALYLLALLNSTLFEGYARRVFVAKQGGWYEVQPDGLESFPIPAPAPEQQRWCERLVETLIWLHGPHAPRQAKDTPFNLMKAYFEQWLNGLVYELYFSGELHARKFTLFAETARLSPPDLSSVPELKKLSRLKEVFEQAYDANAPLRSMLFSLRSLEVVRIIEEPLDRTTTDTVDVGE